jgi:phosphomannomutase
VAAALVLSLWATRGEEAFTLSPRFRVKERLPRHAVPSPELFQELGVEEISGEDGVYLRQGETWVHLRPSNTEPIVRLYGESPDAKALEALLQEVRKRYQGGGS